MGGIFGFETYKHGIRRGIFIWEIDIRAALCEKIEQVQLGGGADELIRTLESGGPFLLSSPSLNRVVSLRD